MTIAGSRPERSTSVDLVSGSGGAVLSAEPGSDRLSGDAVRSVGEQRATAESTASPSGDDGADRQRSHGTEDRLQGPRLAGVVDRAQAYEHGGLGRGSRSRGPGLHHTRVPDVCWQRPRSGWVQLAIGRDKGWILASHAGVALKGARQPWRDEHGIT